MQDYWYEMNVRLSRKRIKKDMVYEYGAWFDKTAPLAKRKQRTLYYPRYLEKNISDLPNIITLGNNTIISDLDETGEIFALIIRNKNLTNAFKKLLNMIYSLGTTPKGYKKQVQDIQKTLATKSI